MIKKYNKLVRDKIPEIIEKDDKIARVEYVDRDEHIRLLNEKLDEELLEYKEDNNIEELVDIVEVIYGILYCKGISLEDFEKIRMDKNKERGEFKKGIKLLEVEEK